MHLKEPKFLQAITHIWTKEGKDKDFSTILDKHKDTT